MATEKVVKIERAKTDGQDLALLPSLSDIDVENHIFDDKICCNPVDNPIVPVGSVSPKPSEVSGQFIEENKSFVSSPSDD